MSQPYIIAGPCAAESEQQVLDTAHGIAQCQLQHPHYTYIFRAGIWKPRTSPDTFQGIGVQGLQWLQRVKTDCHLAVATEVATPEQVNLATQAGVDYLWIGARTAANPMAVQAIADEITGLAGLAGLAIKGILIKNPVNEDAALWLGNIERLEHTGLPVMVIHRGCNHRPCWAMAHQLMQQRPDLTLLMDPSHLSGQASAIQQLCLKAQGLGYQGWMIEAHISPEQALSDAQQQISPAQLEKIIGLIDSADAANLETMELDWLRAMIDEVDDDLWQALAKRMAISRQIGVWKKEHQMSALQPERFQQILQHRIEWGKQHNLDTQTIEQIMDAIHHQSLRAQS